MSIQWNTIQQLKEWAIDACNNLGRSYGLKDITPKKKKKPSTKKDCILFDSIYIIFLKCQIGMMNMLLISRVRLKEKG